MGSLVALGLHLALWEWLFAAAAALGYSQVGGELWVGLALRVVGTLIGAVLSGAGRSMSFSTGAFVGAVCGVAWLTIDAYPDVTLDVARLGAAGALLVAGGVAAMVGGMVWPPPVEVKAPTASHNSSLFKLKTGDGRRKGRPVAWVRVIVGASIAVCGVLGADLIRQGMGKMPQGMFQNVTMTARADALIAGFVAIIGGVVAGAATGRGGRQGLISGFAVAMAILCMSATLPDGPPLAMQFVIDVVRLESPVAGLGLASGLFGLLVVVAGWFGGQLFPVLRRRPRLGQEL